MNIGKCYRCGRLSVSGESLCKDCCAPNKGREAEYTNHQERSIPLLLVPVKLNLPIIISFGAVIISALIVILSNLISDSSMVFRFLALSAVVGLVLAFIGYYRAYQHNPNGDHKKIAMATIVAIIINSALIVVMNIAASQEVIKTQMADLEKSDGADANWQVYSSKSGQFKIKMPVQPTERISRLQTRSGPATMYLSEVTEPDGGSCMVSVAEYSYKDARVNYNDPAFIDNALNNAVDGIIAAANAKLISSRAINLGPFKGLEADLLYPVKEKPAGLKVIVQFYSVKGKLYTLGVTGNKLTSLYRNRAQYFASFEITDTSKEEQRGAAISDEKITNDYQHAQDFAKRAQELSRTAGNSNDWEIVTDQLLKGIKMLEGIQALKPNYLETERLLDSYYSDYKTFSAKGNTANGNKQPATPITDKTVRMPVERSARRYASVSTNLAKYADLQGNIVAEGDNLMILPLTPSSGINVWLKVNGRYFKVLFSKPHDGYTFNNNYASAVTYRDAINSKQSGQFSPALSMDEENTGCRNVNGSFTINSLSYDSNNNLQYLDATFEQRCYEHGVVIAGRAHYEASK